MQKVQIRVKPKEVNIRYTNKATKRQAAKILSTVSQVLFKNTELTSTVCYDAKKLKLD